MNNFITKDTDSSLPPTFVCPACFIQVLGSGKFALHLALVHGLQEIKPKKFEHQEEAENPPADPSIKRCSNTKKRKKTKSERLSATIAAVAAFDRKKVKNWKFMKETLQIADSELDLYEDKCLSTPKKVKVANLSNPAPSTRKESWNSLQETSKNHHNFRNKSRKKLDFVSPTKVKNVTFHPKGTNHSILPDKQTMPLFQCNRRQKRKNPFPQRRIVITNEIDNITTHIDGESLINPADNEQKSVTTKHKIQNRNELRAEPIEIDLCSSPGPIVPPDFFPQQFQLPLSYNLHMDYDEGLSKTDFIIRMLQDHLRSTDNEVQVCSESITGQLSMDEIQVGLPKGQMPFQCLQCFGAFESKLQLDDHLRHEHLLNFKSIEN